MLSLTWVEFDLGIVRLGSSWTWVELDLGRVRLESS